MTTSLDDLPVEPEKTAVGRGDTAVSALVLTVVLEAGDDAAPLRVLSLLARRRCRLVSAAFGPGDDCGGPVLRIELEPPPGREATVVHWLSALVPVLRVDREPS